MPRTQSPEGRLATARFPARGTSHTTRARRDQKCWSAAKAHASWTRADNARRRPSTQSWPFLRRCRRAGSTRVPLDELCVCDGVGQTLVAISVVVIPVSTSNDRQLRHQTTLIGFGCVPVWRCALLEDAIGGWCS